MSEIETMLRRAAAELPVRGADVGARAEAEGRSSTSPTPPSTRRSGRSWSRRPRAGSCAWPTPSTTRRRRARAPRGARVAARARGARRLDSVRRELDEYFAGGGASSTLPIDWTLTPASRARSCGDRAYRLRCDRHLPESRDRRRQPARRAGGGQRARRQPDAGGRALPPRRCAPVGRSAATPAGSSARSSCCGSRACSISHAGLT